MRAILCCLMLAGCGGSTPAPAPTPPAPVVHAAVRMDVKGDTPGVMTETEFLNKYNSGKVEVEKMSRPETAAVGVTQYEVADDKLTTFGGAPLYGCEYLFFKGKLLHVRLGFSTAAFETVEAALTEKHGPPETAGPTRMWSTNGSTMSLVLIPGNEAAVIVSDNSLRAEVSAALDEQKRIPAKKNAKDL